MNTRRAPRHAAARWIVLASAIVAVGCPPSGGYPPPIHDWSTPLPPGVDSNAATFRGRMGALSRSGTYHVRARAATCNPSSHRPPPSYCTVDVRIEPIGDTYLINPDYAPDSGVAVARIENLDSEDTETLFGFRPGVQALYYVWVDRKQPSTKARWTILEVPMGAGVVKAGYQKDLTLCHSYKAGVSDADFYEYKHGDLPCGGSASLQGSRFGQASLLSMEQIASLFGRVAALFRGEFTAARGEWISCSGGCCT
jgi:hypothetical protein